MSWKYDTLDEIDGARIALEMAQEAVYEAQRALREAERIHEASLAVQKIEDRTEALDELADEVGSYDLAEAILLADRGPEEEPEPEVRPRQVADPEDLFW